MECRLQILLIGSSKDEAGPFAREAPLDCVHEPLFRCNNCGAPADERSADALEAKYRAHSADRGFHLTQGWLLDQFGREDDERSPAIVPPILRFPENTGWTASERRIVRGRPLAMGGGGWLE
jgi:hypothetical protein